MRNSHIFGKDFEDSSGELIESEVNDARKERLQIDFDLQLSAEALLNVGLKVDIVEYNQSEVNEYLRSVRRNVLNFNRMHSLNKFSRNPELLSRIVDGRSNYQAQAENYVGYGIPLWHFLMMNGLGSADTSGGKLGGVPAVGKRVVEDLRELFFKTNEIGEQRPARFLELCGGNCDVSKNLAGRWGEIESSFKLLNLLNGPNFKGKLDSIRQLISEKYLSTLSPPPPTPNIVALDYTKEFLDILNNKGIQTSHTDLCLPPDEFISKSEIPSHSVDYMSLIMAFDRLNDLNNAIQNIKSLALKDGSTKLLIGTTLPISHKSDRHNIRAIPEITYWDPSAPGEPRANMMGNSNQHSLSSSQNPSSLVPPADSDNFSLTTRAESLTNLALYLNQNGIHLKRLGWQSYEVVSLDSITATAGELRDQHSHILNRLTFRDPELAQLRDKILLGEIPSDQLICFPQEYELVLLGCEVG